tara:strand:- start:80 stop:874 length:795 start_codon:yes stop_codon:yes gene_type:complete
MHALLSLITALVVISLIPAVSSVGTEDTDQKNYGYIVPNWIKNNAGWWAEGQIDDNSFISSIQWLISNNVIAIDYTQGEIGDEGNVIPSWVKNTAGWWAEDKIQTVAFVGGIKYLIDMGVIIVEQELEEVVEPVENVVESVDDFYMKVNGQNCCSNWAYIGKEYKFQIETFDKKFGNYIDDVKLNVKITSKDGELRRDIGEVITKDGVYVGCTSIPGFGHNSDWFGVNILSVFGEYFGVEKTIKKEFPVFVTPSNGTARVSLCQ